MYTQLYNLKFCFPKLSPYLNTPPASIKKSDPLSGSVSATWQTWSWPLELEVTLEIISLMVVNFAAYENLFRVPVLRVDLGTPVPEILIQQP